MGLSPEDKIVGLKNTTVGDFWAWAYSNLLTNVTRGVFAEYLVGSALGVIDSVPQAGWEEFDLLYDGKKIEVKSSAYIQGWDQARLSVPGFGIAEQGIWDEAKNDWLPGRRRSSDCYVFCLYAEKKYRDVAKALDLNGWALYTALTSQIDETLGTQKTARLSSIESMTGAVRIEQLKERVDAALQERRTNTAG